MLLSPDILDFSRLESGVLTLDLQPCSLFQCVEQSVHLCSEIASNKGLELAYCVDPLIPPVLLIDSTHLQQVLLNLLSNGHHTRR